MCGEWDLYAENRIYARSTNFAHELSDFRRTKSLFNRIFHLMADKVLKLALSEFYS